MKILIGCLAFTVFVVVRFLLISVAFYGIGLFGKFVFHSEVVWTFYHGMFFAFIYGLLRSIVRREKEE